MTESRMSDMHKYRLIADAIGRPFIPRQGQTLVDFKITESRVVVRLEVLSFTESVRDIRFTKKATKLMTWTSSGSYEEFVIEDDTFEPYTERRFGSVTSPAEYHEKREWEGMQYRVGSDASPMDSAYRSTLGYAPMADYWMKG